MAKDGVYIVLYLPKTRIMHGYFEHIFSYFFSEAVICCKY